MSEEPAGLWPGPLPDYDRPPVVETVMAVHFSRLRRLTSVELLEFWRTYLREDYPIASERAAYQVPLETFDLLSGQVQMQMELAPAPERLRYWFLSASNEYLAQLQNDWIAFNWRKASPESGYRHYTYGEERLRGLYLKLGEFCRDSGIGELRPQQIEISYVNHIDASDGGWTRHSDLGLILKALNPPSEDAHLPLPELASYTSQYVASAGHGPPLGRLHVEVQPRVTETGPAFMLRLTYRGSPETPDLEGVFTALNRGHHWIVGGFDEMTTETMHELWGRRDRDV